MSLVLDLEVRGQRPHRPGRPRPRGVPGPYGLWVLAAVGACQPTPSMAPPMPTNISVEGAFVDVGIQDELPVCGRSLEAMERFIELYTGESIHGSPGEKIRYFYVSEELIRNQELCRDAASACAYDGVVYASSLNHTHELVHAVRQRQLGGLPGMLFFEEGIAQAFFGFPISWQDEFTIYDTLDYIDDRPPAGLYERAGHLMSYIAEETSLAQMESFVDATATVVDEPGLDAVVRDVLGTDLATLDEVYSETYPRCSPLASARLPEECDGAPLEWSQFPGSSERFIVEGGLEFDCSHPDAIGPLDGRVWRHYLVEVEEEGSYEIRLNDRVGMTLDMVSCDVGCSSDVDFSTTSPVLQEELLLGPGRYIVRASRALGDTGAIGFTLTGPKSP